MRVKIKDADFSSVSIGKVTKDLSFSYPNYAAYAAVLENGIDSEESFDSDGVYSAGTGHNGPTTFWMASTGDQSYNEITNNPNRITSELIEVVEGMTISMTYAYGVNNTPSIICYDSNRELITPPVAFWATGDGVNTYIIPNGISYIRFQHSGLNRNMSVMGTMPN